MNPLPTYMQQEDEHIGLGMYYVESPWGDSYEWRGPDWSEGTIDGIVRASAAGMLLFGIWMLVQALRRDRISNWRAYAFFACAYIQGLSFSMAEDTSFLLGALRYTRILPAFVVLACVAALRSRPKWRAWVAIDIGVVTLLVLSYLAEPYEVSPYALLFSIPWLLLWIIVRMRTRGGRTVEGLQADAWRLLAAAHLVAMVPQSLASLTMGLEASDEIDLFLGGLVLCMSMSAFLLGVFQVSINRSAHA